jgi:hypothetical protein
MPDIANIVINDGQATPVAHTFAPAAQGERGSLFQDRSGGISVGYPTISVNTVPPSKTSHLYKTRVKVSLPIMENVTNSTVSGIAPAPTLSYTMTADMTFFMPDRSSLQNRKDIIAYAKNSLANALIAAVLEDNAMIF